MSKSEKSSEKSAPELPISSPPHRVYSFYRPHQRVGEDGFVVDNLTGELVRPPSMTKQEFKDECDINNIIAMYKPHEMAAMIEANAQLGVYEDLPDDLDYQKAIHLVREAEASFMSLPSKVRDRFEQDPQQFLAFCSNPANLDAMRELGIANPLAEVQAQAQAQAQAPVEQASTSAPVVGDGKSDQKA